MDHVKMSRLVEPNEFLRVKEEDYDLAIAKYNMTDKMVRENIDSVQRWYKMQHHLPEGGISDARLFRILLATGFSLEKAKEKIENLFLARKLMPDIMGNRDPWAENLKAVPKYGQAVILQNRLDDMSRVLVSSFQCDDVTNFNLWDAIKLGFMVYDYRLSLDVSLGDHYVVDFKDVKLGHITQVTPAMLKKLLFILQGCFAAKIKGIHFLNVPKYAEFLMTLINAALSKKIASRIHIHKDYESLAKYIPKRILPSDLGGCDKSCIELTDDLCQQMAKPETREWFLKQDQFKSDESKRVGKASDMYNDLVGLQGSFRTLNID